MRKSDAKGIRRMGVLGSGLDLMLRRISIFLLCSVLIAVSACDDSEPADDEEATSSASALPVTKWDFQPQGEAWTQASLTALGGHGAPLVNSVPADTGDWCPGYPEASDAERKAFWTGLLSALAEHESTWRADAVGGGGRWFGLVQISPATARGYGCAATSGEALKDGAANLSCAIRIWSQTVTRDGVIAAGGGGVAADWGPFSQSRKREAMRSWVSEQPYCRG